MNCSGVRDRTEFVSSRNFKESDLKNDFHFLEDVLQSKDRAKRTLNQNCGGEKKTPPPTKKKQNIAAADNEIPLILQDTYQRLESYPKSVRNLFQAVRFSNALSFATSTYLFNELYLSVHHRVIRPKNVASSWCSCQTK